MPNDAFRNLRKNTGDDSGTLWSMRHGEHHARCALIAWRGAWEVRVLVDGTMLLAEPCEVPAAAFAVAERWKNQMLRQGWRPVRRPAVHRRPADERYPA